MLSFRHFIFDDYIDIPQTIELLNTKIKRLKSVLYEDFPPSTSLYHDIDDDNVIDLLKSNINIDEFIVWSNIIKLFQFKEINQKYLTTIKEPLLALLSDKEIRKPYKDRLIWSMVSSGLIDCSYLKENTVNKTLINNVIPKVDIELFPTIINSYKKISNSPEKLDYLINKAINITLTSAGKNTFIEIMNIIGFDKTMDILLSSCDSFNSFYGKVVLLKKEYPEIYQSLIDTALKRNIKMDPCFEHSYLSDNFDYFDSLLKYVVHLGIKTNYNTNNFIANTIKNKPEWLDKVNCKNELMMFMIDFASGYSFRSDILKCINIEDVSINLNKEYIYKYITGIMTSENIPSNVYSFLSNNKHLLFAIYHQLYFKDKVSGMFYDYNTPKETKILSSTPISTRILRFFSKTFDDFKNKYLEQYINESKDDLNNIGLRILKSINPEIQQCIDSARLLSPDLLTDIDYWLDYYKNKNGDTELIFKFDGFDFE